MHCQDVRRDEVLISNELHSMFILLPRVGTISLLYASTAIHYVFSRTLPRISQSPGKRQARSTRRELEAKTRPCSDHTRTVSPLSLSFFAFNCTLWFDHPHPIQPQRNPLAYPYSGHIHGSMQSRRKDASFVLTLCALSRLPPRLFSSHSLPLFRPL
ncbi:hypothetical protein EDD21DRAFT_368487 [Dissophora ornata]|nr:hypothetical protein EDD21DRAFT_368487 [Dissophora ornata]